MTNSSERTTAAGEPKSGRNLLDLRSRHGAGDWMYGLIAELYPICRSITGDGVRRTLRRLAAELPIDVHEIPSGTRVFDWTIPNEWNIRDAYIKDGSGNRVVDFQASNLHVVNYSVPIHTRLRLAELVPHLHSLPAHPDWVPYRTSYYKETWGFCLSHRQLEALGDDEYEVCIDASLAPGSLTYAELLLPGETEREVLLSAHVCHPSLANDNLSGIALLTYLAKGLAQFPHRYTYRFVFAPGTIGSIAWLARNEHLAGRIAHGLVVSCVGDPGGPTFKKSRRGDSTLDIAVEHVLRHLHADPDIRDFSPYGYDERQYCSPGFDLPVGLLERSAYGEFPQYHTSADNLDLVTPAALESSFETVVTVLDLLERDRTFMNTNPKCEPQLGKRGLYDAIGGDNERATLQLALLWVLNQSDGTHSLLDIARRSGLAFDLIARAADLLWDAELLRELPDPTPAPRAAADQSPTRRKV